MTSLAGFLSLVNESAQDTEGEISSFTIWRPTNVIHHSNRPKKKKLFDSINWCRKSISITSITSITSIIRNHSGDCLASGSFLDVSNQNLHFNKRLARWESPSECKKARSKRTSEFFSRMPAEPDAHPPKTTSGSFQKGTLLPAWKLSVAF